MIDEARVAIVEDQRASRSRMEAMLSMVEWARLAAEGCDGRDAIALRFSADPPDVLVVNGQMPVLDGPGAIAAIRARERAEGLPRQRIVIASVSAGYRESGLAAGADAACTPEASSPEILATIAAALFLLGS